MAFVGATSAKADDWRGYNSSAMQQHIAADRARLNEDIRCGRSDAAARDAADLARDQRALQASHRDVRYDRSHDTYLDRRSGDTYLDWR
jgi:hypothetical protein